MVLNCYLLLLVMPDTKRQYHYCFIQFLEDCRFVIVKADLHGTIFA